MAGGQIYNVADDAPIAIAEIRRMHAAAESNGAADSEVADPWEGIVDTGKIKAGLGFRPIYPSVHAAQKAKAL